MFNLTSVVRHAVFVYFDMSVKNNEISAFIFNVETIQISFRTERLWNKNNCFHLAAYLFHIVFSITNVPIISIFSDNKLLLDLPVIPGGRLEGPAQVCLPLLVKTIIANSCKPGDLFL